MNLCNSLNLSQLVTQATRTTDTSVTLIDVTPTTNKSFLTSCDVNISAVADHCLVAVSLNLKASSVFTRSYKNYNPGLFRGDLMCVPFHLVNIIDDLDDQVEVFNNLFLDTLNEHAQIKRIKIKSCPNPFITAEIKQSMRDRWQKKARKTNDVPKLELFKFFRQEVKRVMRIVEKENVRSELLKCSRSTNSVWKVIDQCLPNKDSPLTTVEDPMVQGNRFSDFYVSVGVAAAPKAKALCDHNGFLDESVDAADEQI